MSSAVEEPTAAAVWGRSRQPGSRIPHHAIVDESVDGRGNAGVRFVTDLQLHGNPVRRSDQRGLGLATLKASELFARMCFGITTDEVFLGNGIMATSYATVSTKTGNPRICWNYPLTTMIAPTVHEMVPGLRERTLPRAETVAEVGGVLQRPLRRSRFEEVPVAMKFGHAYGKETARFMREHQEFFARALKRSREDRSSPEVVNVAVGCEPEKELTWARSDDVAEPPHLLIYDENFSADLTGDFDKVK
ncbi:hypothetical protein J6590_104052 [Homalodisca vitripennis]|nr:hypothetical protein J6590_104052 [Homalodisca vitripennis]